MFSAVKLKIDSFFCINSLNLTYPIIDRFFLYGSVTSLNMLWISIQDGGGLSHEAVV